MPASSTTARPLWFRPPNKKATREVVAENEKYGDLLVLDFEDSYDNLTIKVLSSFNYILTNIDDVAFIMKADDDVFINIPLVTALLDNIPQTLDRIEQLHNYHFKQVRRRFDKIVLEKFKQLHTQYSNFKEKDDKETHSNIWHQLKKLMNNGKKFDVNAYDNNKNIEKTIEKNKTDELTKDSLTTFRKQLNSGSEKEVLDRMIELLTKSISSDKDLNIVLGRIYGAGPVQRNGDWAVKESLYPYDVYPPYMSGTSYIFSLQAALKVVLQSAIIPMIPVEDAFITGILPQMTGVEKIGVSGFTYLDEEQASSCVFLMDQKMVGNNMTTEDNMYLWTQLKINVLSF